MFIYLFSYLSIYLSIYSVSLLVIQKVISHKDILVSYIDVPNTLVTLIFKPKSLPVTYIISISVVSDI